jgi:hypothetical protein
MQPSDKQPFCLADFQPFLKELTEMEDPSVLIGGMAVAAWADVHLELPEHPLFDLPIYSKDVDLRGRKATSALLAGTMFTSGAEIRGQVAATRKNAPHMGRVYAISLFWRGRHTSIEVLERLPGLDTSLEDKPQGASLLIRSGLTVLDPCSLFICKLHAANSRPAGQAGNDVKHLAILARVIPRFLAKLRAVVVPEYDGKEDAERLLKKIEACESGLDVFKIPLATAEKARLIEALSEHLAWDSGQS